MPGIFYDSVRYTLTTALVQTPINGGIGQYIFYMYALYFHCIVCSQCF